MIKVYMRKAAHKALRDAIPATLHEKAEWIFPETQSEIPRSADLAVDTGTGATSSKALFWAAQRGCRVVWCLPESAEVFQKTLRGLIYHGLPDGKHAEIDTVIVDSGLCKVTAQ